MMQCVAIAQLAACWQFIIYQLVVWDFLEHTLTCHAWIFLTLRVRGCNRAARNLRWFLGHAPGELETNVSDGPYLGGQA